MISPNIHIMTEDDLERIKNVAFQRGVERGKFEAGTAPKPKNFNYTADGRGVLDAVYDLFSHRAFSLGEGDALIPVQEAYKAWRLARKATR